MNFNFNSLAETSFSSSSQNYLKPYDIYKVNLTKIAKSEIKGSKDPNAVYPVVELEFTSTEGKGIFTQNIFIPNSEQDFVRKENETSHKLMPSRFDQFQFTLMQIVEAINPEGAQKIKNNAGKLKTIEDFISIVIKALDKKNSVDVYLKLVGQNNNGTVYSRLPNACLIGRDGNPAALNFINADSSKLFFSNYEVGQMNKYKEAKPTNMSEVENNPDKSDEDLDLDNIDL